MNVQEKLNDLITEFRSLKTEDERVCFDKKMEQLLKEMNPDERKTFRIAFLNSARQTLSAAKELKKEVDVRLQLNGIENYLSLSQIAQDYFGKSRSWLYQRINGLAVNGKPAQFTEEEKMRFKEALLDLGRKINETALKFA